MLKRNLKFAILKNEIETPAKWWIEACNELGVEYDIVNFNHFDWLEACTAKEYDCYLCCPSGTTSLFKKLQDERLYILSEELGKFIYPSLNEVLLHENKKYTYYWLKANSLPHLKTGVYYKKKEALEALSEATIPVVMKTSLGSTASGVFIFSNKTAARKKISKAFSKGIKRRIGPNMRLGHIFRRFWRVIRDKEAIRNKLMMYNYDFSDAQRGFVIMQEYIKHEFEWRSVKIGDSYFAYKKMKKGDFCSGVKMFEYGEIPESLLNFTEKICDIGKFNSMSIDSFETEDGKYIINELQTVFGHENPYLTKVGGDEGRYIRKDGKWIFEKGNFNSYLSFKLRLQNIIQLLGSNEKI